MFYFSIFAWHLQKVGRIIENVFLVIFYRTEINNLMKRLVLAVAVLGLVSCNQDKIAYVDNGELINDYQEKIDVEAKFKIKVEAFSKKRDSLSQSFQLEAQEFDTKSKGMGQKAAQEQYNVLMQKRQFLGQQIQQEEQAIQQASQTEIDSLISKVKKHVKAYGKKEGYTFILGANEGGSVMYGADAKNVTSAVLKELNDAYKK